MVYPAHLELEIHRYSGTEFWCFWCQGLFMKVDGTCNDYLGKVFWGTCAKVPETATFKADENIIVGNVALMVL